MDNKRGAYEEGYQQGEFARLWLLDKCRKVIAFLRRVIWRR